MFNYKRKIKCISACSHRWVGDDARRASYLNRIMEPAERHTNGDDYKFFMYQTRVGVPM
jgi:hypothetical protein